jgi:hypothetical protein
MDSMNSMNSQQNRQSSQSGSRRGSKAKLQQFKNEVANSMNIDLKQGYNGDLTSREAGSIGGEMVKRMIDYAENSISNN